MGGQLGRHWLQQQRRELAADLAQRHHLLAVDRRAVVDPRQTLGRGGVEILPVLLHQLVEIFLRDRPASHLEAAAWRDDEEVERVGRGEVLDGQRPGGQPVGELGQRLGIHRLLIDELRLVLRVARQEGVRLREVLRLRLGQERREVLDPLRAGLARAGLLLLAQRRLQRAHLLLLGLDLLGRLPRRGVAQRRTGAGEGIGDDAALPGLEHRPGVAIVALARIAPVQLQEHARQPVVRQQAVVGCQILAAQRVVSELPGQALERGHGLAVEPQRLLEPSALLVRSRETKRDAPL